jgi:hypothetical protein
MAADRAGVLRVMLRAPSDKKVVDSQGVTVRDIQGSKTFEVAPRTPDAAATPIIISPSNRQRSEITIVRGTQESTVGTQ